MDWESAQKTLLALFEQSTPDAVIGWTDQAPELCALYASVGDWTQAYTYARQITHPMHEDVPLLPYTLTGWHETEALLRSQAVLAQWDGDAAQAMSQLQAALALAQEIGLPGEAWPILGELGKLHEEQGAVEPAREAYRQASNVIHQLAETMDDLALRCGFLAAQPVRQVLERGSTFTKHEPYAASR